MAKSFRYYQTGADLAIYDELLINNKCLVKMFCGTGKSLLMHKCTVAQDKNLVVYVFPSLALIHQFYKDYLHTEKTIKILKICSDKEKSDETNLMFDNKSTTEPEKIKKFLKNKNNKIICITYQSFETLMNNMDGYMIDVCVFDEAHHAVGSKWQTLIFENDVCHKQIFFTATPKNENGVVIYDRNNQSAGMCGKMVYEYSYLDGLNDSFLNPFEIRIDLYTENTNKSLYESIARAIIVSGNTRVLTYHMEVNTDRDTSVLYFVNEELFKATFYEVLAKEFPDKRKTSYKKIQMLALVAATKPEQRKDMLKQFDKTSGNDIIIISSCKTIGEGVDTKNANMCVFVDSKTSIVEITQNIGRIVRPQPNISTILIPCWVDKDKYLDCGGDKDKCDEVIRQDMSKGGNFNGILNVLSALKQEDEDLYDICLHYTDMFSPQEIRNNLQKQGFTIAEQVGDGEITETLEHLLDTNIDYETDEEEEDMIMRVAAENNVCIEIHTDSLENPVESYNVDCESGDIVRLYKVEDTEENVYHPIVKTEGYAKRSKEKVNAPDRKKRQYINVHTNPDVKVLWNVAGDIDLTKNICSCVIDCEVVEYDPMEVAQGIVERARQRVANEGGLLPKRCDNKEKRKKENREQENQDAHWLGRRRKNCKYSVREYLDNNLPGWNDVDTSEMKQLNIVNGIIKRAEDRRNKNLNYYPIEYANIENDIEKIQEKKDKQKINNWRLADRGSKGILFNSVKKKLDDAFPMWNDTSKENTVDKEALQRAKEIYENAKKREKLNQNFLPLCSIDEQQDSDYQKLNSWKRAKNGCKNFRCSANLEEYLNKNLPGWDTVCDKEYLDNSAYEIATKIVSRANERKVKGIKILPTLILRTKNDREKDIYNGNKDLLEEHELQSQDARKLASWKLALKPTESTIGQYRCSDEVRDYLDTNLPGWRPIKEEKTSAPKKKSMKLSKSTVKKEENAEHQRRERIKTEISQLHQRYKTLHSDNLHKEFNQEPGLWYKYHEIAEENERSFPEDEIPRNRIIQEINKIQTKRTRLVVDLGCGKAQIAQRFHTDPRFQFINYDHISSSQNVISCDISRTPLDDNAAEICILSLAMWGSNCEQYIQEANRILESDGKLYIIEPTKRWTDKDEHNNIVDGTEGNKLRTLLLESGFIIKSEHIQKFCLFECVKK